MPEENLSVADGIVGMLNAFVDPAGLAKRARARLFWLWPLIVILIVFIVVGYLMLPYTMQLVDTKIAERISQQNIPPERMETAKNVAHIMGRVSIGMTPLFVIAFLALFAWLIVVIGSVVDVRAKFRDVFSLVAACSLISTLQYIATYIVIRSKGDEITSQEQLLPPFGLDIFLQGVHGPLLAILNFFSIFELWQIVILGLALSYLAGVSKGKAFVAITPAWLIPLIFKLVGSLFSGASSS